MALNPFYMISPSLQEYYVDKTTGLPLANGKMYFWEDEQRTVPKPVYELSGSPPNYSYTVLPNPVNLSSVGTPQDASGNDIKIYYYPYDDNGAIQLYYITVTDENGVPQFTREGWPNVTPSTEVTELENFVTNPQFLLHNNIPATDTTAAGEITQASTVVAQGGWTFDRPNASTADDFVIFQRFGSSVTNPTGNPRYAIRVSCISPNSGDSYKDLRLKFDDVNMFSSDIQEYTFGFSALSNSGGSITVDLVLIKNYGTGGSTETETDIATLTIDNTYGGDQATFVFGLNTNKIIGSLNDDYLQLALRFPTDTIFDVSLTDFILTPNAVEISEFPDTTNNQTKALGIFGSITTPKYDGSSYYLPVVATPYGATYDNAYIGFIMPTMRTTAPPGFLLCDGSQYETTAISAEGVPYARLLNEVFWNSTLNVPRFGTGSGYFLANLFSFSSNQLVVSNNNTGSATTLTDGAIPTGFTFNLTKQGSPGFSCSSYIALNSTTFFIQNSTTSGSSASAGTSGFSVAIYRLENSLVPQIAQITCIAATTLAGTYFTFDSNVGYYVWFKVDGTGSDPAIGGRTGIEVDLLSTDTAEMVTLKLATALNGWQVSSIQTLAASSITPGSYFNISSTTQDFYVYYIVNGIGNDPSISNKKAIPVSILSTDDATQVATKTQIAINQKYYAIPDLRGAFLRAQDNGKGIDSLVNDRYSLVPGIYGDQLGTIEVSSNLSHAHTATLTLNNNTNIARNNAGPQSFSPGANVGFVDITGSILVGLDGVGEARPYNIFVNYLIKY